MSSALADVQGWLRRSPIAQRFLDGAAWSVLGTVIFSGVTMLMWMLVARILNKEVYGQLVVIQSTLGMVGVFAGFGIGAAATRYAAELKTRDTTRLGHILTLAERTNLGFGLIASTVLAASAGWMASHMLNTPDLKVPLAISAAAVFFTALDSYQKSVLIGLESMRAFAMGSVAGIVAGFPTMLLAANYYGLQGAAVAIPTNAFLQATISRNQMTRELKKYGIRRNAEGCMNELPVLWHFAFPALLAGAMVGPAHWTAQALLANTANGYAQLAVLGIAMHWFHVVTFLPGTLGRVVLPILTDHVTNDDYHNSRKILLYAMGANALVAVPLAGILGVLSPHIMNLYGRNFENDYAPLVVAVIVATLVAILNPVGDLLAASSRMWLGALMNTGWALTYIGSAYFLINRGATGIVLALGIGYITHAAWTIGFSVRYIKQQTVIKIR